MNVIEPNIIVLETNANLKTGDIFSMVKTINGLLSYYIGKVLFKICSSFNEKQSFRQSDSGSQDFRSFKIVFLDRACGSVAKSKALLDCDFIAH